MSLIIDWCFRHWQLITELLAMLITIIVVCCKKVKVTNSVLTSLLQSLPDLIQEAEQAYPEAKTGDDKLKYVLKMAVSRLVGLTGKSSEECLKLYGSFILEAVENILQAPTKAKGDLHA